MSTDARGELVRGARPNAGELRAKSSKATGIPAKDHTEREKVLQRMRDQDDDVVLTIEDAREIWAELPICCRENCTPESVLADIQDS